MIEKHDLHPLIDQDSIVDSETIEDLLCRTDHYEIVRSRSRKYELLHDLNRKGSGENT